MQQNVKVKYLKKTSVIILIMLLIVYPSGCSVQKETDSSLKHNLTKTQVQEDRKQVIEYLENVHPFFLLEKDQEKYKVAKEKYMKATKRAMPITEFQKIKRYHILLIGIIGMTLSPVLGVITQNVAIE